MKRTIKEHITVQDICDMLNEMLELDYDCVKNLVEQRVKCNSNILNHETVQVRFYAEDTYPSIGIVGVLNGLFGIDENGRGPLCYIMDDEKGIIEFKPTPEAVS